MEHKVSTEGRKDYEKTGWERRRGGSWERRTVSKAEKRKRERERERIKVKSLRLIELEVTDRVPSVPGATNLMQLLYNSLCRLALTTNRTISKIELPPRKFLSPSTPPSLLASGLLDSGLSIRASRPRDAFRYAVWPKSRKNQFKCCHRCCVRDVKQDCINKIKIIFLMHAKVIVI